MSRPRRKYKPRPISLEPWLVAADSAAYLTADEVKAGSWMVDAGTQAIITATDTHDSWRAIFEALNLIEAFGQQGKAILPVWREWHSSCQDLCVTITNRRKGGVLALHAEEVQQMQSIATTWRDVLTQSTRGQYREALDTAERKIVQALARRDDKITRVDCEHGVLRKT